MKLLRLCLALVLCSAIGATQQKEKQKQAGPPQPVIDASKLEPGLYAIITTSFGVITAQLFEKETPITVANFVGLARGTKPWLDPKSRKPVMRPLYSNLVFHRVIPQFMIQTGDPTGTGGHDCGFVIPDEFVEGLKFDRPGRLGMANINQPNTGACQFFITEVADKTLDGKHTIFGQVVDGQEFVGKIARVIRDENDKPRMSVRLISITFLRVAAKVDP